MPKKGGDFGPTLELRSETSNTGGTTSDAKRKKLEADSYGYLQKKIKDLEVENKRLKNNMLELQNSSPVNPSKEMRSKNTLLQKELMVLQRQHAKLEKDHEELRNSDTHRELTELKDKMEEEQNRDREVEDSINDELEGRKNRIEALQSVITRLQLQNQSLEEGELSKELKVKENKIKVLNGIIAKDKEMIEKLQKELYRSTTVAYQRVIN